MALTRKMLTAMGIEENQIQAIIDAHMESVTGLKNENQKLTDELEKAKEDAGKLANVQKELDDLKKEDYKGKYESEKKDHDALKDKIASEQTKGAKEKALRAYFEGKNIKDANLNIAMRGVRLEDIELEEDKIKDTKALDALVEGDYKTLVTAPAKQPKQKRVDSGAQIGGSEEGGGSGIMSLSEALHESYDK